MLLLCSPSSGDGLARRADAWVHNRILLQQSLQADAVNVAARRYGDKFDGKTTTLCVRRATYWDPELKREDPEKKGICSNFLCDAKPGTEITMTGDSGYAR